MLRNKWCRWDLGRAGNSCAWEGSSCWARDTAQPKWCWPWPATHQPLPGDGGRDGEREGGMEGDSQGCLNHRGFPGARQDWARGPAACPGRDGRISFQLPRPQEQEQPPSHGPGGTHGWQTGKGCPVLHDTGTGGSCEFCLFSGSRSGQVPCGL